MPTPSPPWEVAYYETAAREKPVKQWLDGLEDSHPNAANGIDGRIDFLIKHLDQPNGRQNAIEARAITLVEDSIWSLKAHVRGAKPRILGFFWTGWIGRDGRFFLLAAAELKDQRALSEGVKNEAKQRRADWFRRRGGRDDDGNS